MPVLFRLRRFDVRNYLSNLLFLLRSKLDYFLTCYFNTERKRGKWRDYKIYIFTPLPDTSWRNDVHTERCYYRSFFSVFALSSFLYACYWGIVNSEPKEKLQVVRCKEVEVDVF